MLDFAQLRADVAFFTPKAAEEAPRARDCGVARAALGLLMRKHAADLPPLPAIASPEDVERYVPEVRYLLALLKEADIKV